MRMLIYILIAAILGVSTVFASSCNTELPNSRTFIITDRREFEKIVSDDFDELEIDFEKEMLIVYTFVTEYVLPAKIAEIQLNGDTLTVNYHIEYIEGELSARAPFQRWLLVKLDKLDISEVKSSVSDVEKDSEEDATEENLAYHAQLFDERSADSTWIKENFQKKNRLQGAIYY